jgi:hypothetical protein
VRLTILCLAAISGSCVAKAAPQPVDLRPALVVGTRPISGYIFDKYYRRFVQTIGLEQQRPPSPAEAKAWLEHFLAQQIVTTEAESLGYLEHPEVQHTVARMERHMLMQPDGPLFQVIAAPVIHSDEELKTLYASSARRIDGVFARFEDEQELEEALGKDFAIQSSDEQTRRIQRCQTRPTVQVFEGRLSWPYEPFGEIATVLANAEAGHWIRHHEPDLGTYFFFVRAEAMRSLGPFEQARPAFGRMVTTVHGQMARKRYRLEQLFRAKLSLDAAMGERTLQLYRDLPKDSSALPELKDAALAPATLFRYRDGAETVVVSVDAFYRWFNDKLLRRALVSTADLYETVEDYVVEALSLKLIHQEGWDESPQFAEDRRGFAALQVLDLYEREVLAPRLPVGMAEIERYYRQHLAEFQQTLKIKGRLLTFASAHDADVWIQDYRNGADNQKGAVSDSAVEVSREQPIHGMENVQQELMREPDRRVLGPLRYDDSYLVFIKHATVETGAIPLADMAESIRGRLLRPLLDAREQELAAELARRYNIEDHIDYASFGLGKAEVKVPWKN